MKKLAIAAALAATFGIGYAWAQVDPWGTAPYAKGLGLAVTSCAGQSYPLNTYQPLNLSLGGTLC